MFFPRKNCIFARNFIYARVMTKKRLIILIFTILSTVATWAQTTDYSGTYYIASVGYNSANTTTNYYLCPTEGWCYYLATDDFSANDTGMPFLTTYQCRNGVYDVRKAIWTIEKAPAPNDAYYYIKQPLTGRYLTSNGTIRTTGNADRMRVHLESVASANLDDKELFTIEFYNNHYVISPKGVTGSAQANQWLVVNGGNKNALTGQSGKQGGPTGYENTAGIIGVYTKDDGSAPFFLEPAPSFTPAPTITNNFDGTITITGTGTIYYTTDGTEPTTSSATYSSAITLTDAITVIKALAKDGTNYESMVVTYELPKCEKPVITVSNGTVTITTNTAGASIYYTDDDTQPSSASILYNGPFPIGNIAFIRAIAVKAGCITSNEAYFMDFKTISSSTEITNMQGLYLLASDFTSTASIGTATEPFTGTIDGQMNVINGLDHALVAYAEDAVIKNVILDNVGISGGTNVGSICNEATGNTRIYNCGVLATNSTVSKDSDGYDVITSCSSTISGSGYVGGIVGLLNGSSRVVNCFSYASVSGGSYVGGIVGYNNVATTASNLQTMVMNCMFYGEVSGTSIAPIYNGEIITNDGDADGVNNFNYFRLESAYIQDNTISKVYNCALGAETRFLQRFEFFRHLLNSNRELAAWWATGDASNKDEMMKWVMEPTQIGTTTPYPILKTPGKYASVVNYTPSTTAYDEAHRNEGRMLTNEGDGGVLHVTIQTGTNTGNTPFSEPSGAGLKTGETGVFDLTITDKDFEHFNYNYGKVQLPYYNDYCDGNYTENRVVTGWKIVSIMGGTAGSYSTGDDVTYSNGALTATPYNFADRNCTNKDLYGTNGSNRVFNQGAYWDVPKGVTAITIEPYWGKAVYLSDAYWDVVYKNGTGGSGYGAGKNYDAMTTAANVPNVGGGQRYDNSPSFDGQTIYTTIENAISSSALYAGTNENTYSARSVYDYAVVLVGNYHHNGSIAGGGKPYTVTSVDLDGDNEPDYSFMLRFNGRTTFHPVRYDFLNLIGLGMAQKSTGGIGSYNLGIMQPKYWFEVTNTALFRVTQFEYSKNDRVKKPLILQGGVIEQWVTQQQDAGDRVSYFHVGGNVWFKEFHRGSHQDNEGKKTPHPPVSVTGGDFNKFYLTGLYQPKAAIYDDNAECYINGGRFGEIAGAGMEGIGSSDGKGNITWVIDNADIKEFYGGGINHAKPVHGNIHTIISNSHVDQFCGGPKFGDMASDRTVTTTATNCTFGTYFGAGYGGNSYNRIAPRNHSNIINFPHSESQAGNHASWNAWLNVYYKQEYNANNGGISTQFDYQFLPMSSNTDNVARIFVDYVAFSLATTHNVTSDLTGCTITSNFYGGGSLGKADGDVTSTLTDCTVNGNVFGAGYSASLPTVEVMAIGFQTEPYYYEDLGTYRNGVFPSTTTYTWQHGSAISIDKTNHILYTTEDLTALGTVSGNVTLNVTGNTLVEGKIFDVDGNVIGQTGGVFGGGDESKVTGTLKTVQVNINTTSANHATSYINNVFGGGNNGDVASETEVNVIGSSFVKDDVFGGGKGQTTVVENDVTVNISATIGRNVYGGSALGHVNATKGPNYATNPNDIAAVSGKTTNVNLLNGGTVTGSLFGGGLGQRETGTSGDPGYLPAIVSNVYGPVTVTVEGGSATNVFGCNDQNGSPKNTVEVIVNGTNPTNTSGSTPVYAIQGVYGGGNLAHYDPTTPSTYPTVTINGCSTSVKDVFGGGNAAAVPYTSVTINGGDIDRAFAGGNGESGTPANVGWKNTEATPSTDDYGAGTASLLVTGGTINQVFGGSNANGKIRESSTVTIDKATTGTVCTMHIGEVFGGGNLAVGDVATINIGCTGTGSNEYIDYVYGGANQADVTGNIELNITQGHINNVFGGNNLSGNINGTITVNIEKDDNSSCASQWYVGNVYGGGNQAAYNGTPDVNIINGTVSGNVFGGGNEAGVHGGDVAMTGGSVLGGLYGGCNTSGVVDGNIVVSVTNGTIGANGTTADVYGGGFGPGTSTTGNVEVTIDDSGDGNTVVIWGDVYGGSAKGSVNSTDKTTTVTLLSGTIHGDLYGGGLGDATHAAAVNGIVAVNVNGGTVSNVFGCNNANGAPQSTVTVNINETTANTMHVTNVYGGGNLATYTGNPQVNITQGTVTANVYGGGLGSTATVTGNPAVNINGGTVGQDVFGGGSEAAVNGATHVTVSSGTIGLDVYGGGALANTGATTVDIMGGTITRNVYGGGLGDNTHSPQEGGAVTVNIGDGTPGPSETGEHFTGTATIGGSVYGCNNFAGSPQDNVTVNIYQTYHTDGASGNGVEGSGYAIANVFGGGNAANFEPSASGKKATVNIFGCYNTIGRVFGGGDAAATPSVETNIQGGRINIVFGGGNGEAGPPGANVNGTVDLSIHGGNVGQFFGGSNQNGTITDVITITVDANGPCGSMMIDEFFCGGNFAAITHDLTTTMYCSEGMVVKSLYGGCNQANITGNVTLNVEGGTYEYVYGGSKGIAGRPADITGNVTLNLHGGTIENAFGGSNINGNITGTITVNVLDKEDSDCPLYITNIYGGSNLTNYQPTDPTLESPVVNVVHIKSGVSGNVYGGSKGAEGSVNPTIVQANPLVNIGYDATKMSSLATYLSSIHYAVPALPRAIVAGSVFGGGDAAKIQGNTTIFLRDRAKVFGNVYGGGNMGEVTGNTKVIVFGDNQ